MIHIVKSTALTQCQQKFKPQVITKGFVKEEWWLKWWLCALKEYHQIQTLSQIWCLNMSTYPLLWEIVTLFASSAEPLPALHTLNVPSPKQVSYHHTGGELLAEAVESAPHWLWCQHLPDAAQKYPLKDRRDVQLKLCKLDTIDTFLI